jgi:hypothetical protein
VTGLAWLAAAARASAAIPCAGASFAVAGPALLSDRIGADAIRLGAETAAIRSGCAEARVRVHAIPTGEHVMRAVFTGCADPAEEVTLWLRVRDDCSKLAGRIGILPKRHIRLFEATRLSAATAGAWPEPCACEPPRDDAACEGTATTDCS